MKIYSLQEENDKLNASRGIVHPGIHHGMFDVKKTAAPVRQQNKTVSPPTRQERWSSSAMQSRRVPSASQQGRVPVSPQQKPQQRPPKNQKRPLGLLVGWILFMVFLFLVSYISDLF